MKSAAIVGVGLLGLLCGCKEASPHSRANAENLNAEIPSAEASPRVVSAVSAAPSSGEWFIADGRCAGEIVLPERASRLEREAAERLCHYLEQATGVAVPLVQEDETAPDAQKVRIYVGKTEALRQQGIDVEQLPMETYGTLRAGRALFLFGKDEEAGVPWVQLGGRPVGADHWSQYKTPATRWAVNDFAERELKVRWLWPGPLGTYVPRKEGGVALPPEGKRLTRPPLERRTYMAKFRLVSASPSSGFYLLPQQEQEVLQREGMAWMQDHQAGNRSPLIFGHSFSHWWPKYGKARPDLFAEPPAKLKVKMPFPNENRVKLRLANPEVLDVIEEEYRAAGMPAVWPMSPNDGSGFDTSEGTVAWDKPPHQNKVAIWKARGQLTGRYVEFWNRVHERLSRLNPDVALSVMAYASYKEPPEPGSVKAKLRIALVNNYKGEATYESWLQWSKAASGMMLRPNWWHFGVNTPYLEPVAQGEYLRFAREHGLTGFTCDTLFGHWALQGLNYYVVARIVADPSREPEALIREYCEAFHPANEEVQAYFAYWMKESASINFAGASGLISRGDVPGQSEYEELVKKQGIHSSILVGGHRAIPHLYSDERLEKGFQLLEQARAKAPHGSEARQRVEFLIEGLKELRLTRDVLEVGYAIKEKKDLEQLPDFRAKATELRDMRRQLTCKHVLWGEAAYENEIRRRIPTTVEALGMEIEVMDGL